MDIKIKSQKLSSREEINTEIETANSKLIVYSENPVKIEKWTKEKKKYEKQLQKRLQLNVF